MPVRLTRLAALVLAAGLAAPGRGALAEAAAAPPPVPAAPSPAPQRRFTLNFQNAPIESVVQAIGRVVGLNYVLAPDVTATVTVETRQALDADRALDVLRAILETHGFTARATGSIYQIVRAEQARGVAAPIVVGDQPPERSDDEVVTQLVPLRRAAAADAAAHVRPLVSARGLVAPHASTNILAVTDTVGNLRRLLEVVRILDAERAQAELEVIPLRVADASEVAAALGRLLVPPGAGERAALVLADRRANALIVHGRTGDRALIRRLATDLDQVSDRPRLFVFRPEHRKAEELGATLRASDPSVAETVRIVADQWSNTLLVAAPPHLWTGLETTLRDLDRPARQIALSVTVAEVALTDGTTLGIDWAALLGPLGVASLTGVAGSLQAVTDVPGVLAAPGFTAVVAAVDEFAVALNAFAAVQRVRLVATPRVVTSDTRTAVINVSESVPVVTAQAAAIGQTTSALQVTNQQVEYRDVGVVLKATPRIGPGGTVALEVKQELSELGGSDPVTGAREIFKRQVETTAVLTEGQALVLAGLVRPRTIVEEQGVPFLKEAPLVGHLFRSRSVTRTSSELLFLITPQVLPRDRADAGR
jgi:general secretion pathway protein D